MNTLLIIKSFILTIWNVNCGFKDGIVTKYISFILTIWNVNAISPLVIAE
ncbi:Uncharacterised protein [Clostridioides difficile]|nr:hypothetical protein QAY_1344 [Clostridioides difficile CD18]EQJ23153.1 hypothetical protein QS1_1538 [Clostridioides difficile P11]EQJ24406.1 hypothetical protein QQY_1442 [Clostridioides difficile P9]VFD35287.1 Uncharacterised protein [Clostridioides difficile]VFD45140.1 Uncharacterised protein [Clostridioides difficile]